MIHVYEISYLFWIPKLDRGTLQDQMFEQVLVCIPIEIINVVEEKRQTYHVTTYKAGVTG